MSLCPLSYGDFMKRLDELAQVMNATDATPMAKAAAERELSEMRTHISESAIHFDDGWRPDA